MLATPHIAASTREGQERVGIDTVDALCEFLERGIVRNAVNAPALAPAVAARLGPMLPAAQRFGQVASALLPGPLTSVGVRVYGELAALPSRPVADAILTGLFSGMLAEGVSPVNVRAIAGDRGVEVVESQSSRAHDHVDVVSLKLWSGTTERWLEAAFSPGRDARLVRIDDVRVDAPLGRRTARHLERRRARRDRPRRHDRRRRRPQHRVVQPRPSRRRRRRRRLRSTSAGTTTPS